jgi:transposase InsO family protein
MILGNVVLNPKVVEQRLRTSLLAHHNEQREFRGRELQHPYELYLTITDIAHRRTEVCSPQTNGFCERLHRTIQEEFFTSAFRRTLYDSVEQLQNHLDAYLNFYNRERSHQGYRTQGQTPYQAFLDGVPKSTSQERVA